MGNGVKPKIGGCSLKAADKFIHFSEMEKKSVFSLNFLALSDFPVFSLSLATLCIFVGG